MLQKPTESEAEQLTSCSGPFPDASMSDALERRWLHYAFIEPDGTRALVANIAWLNGEDGFEALRTSILLVYDGDRGWNCSQWTATTGKQQWSSFRVGCKSGETSPGFRIDSAKGWPAANLKLRRTSTPGPSGCATFRDNNWQRWQAEPGVRATGTWRASDDQWLPFDAVGYHERVRGCWNWPHLGGWVFGFCNHGAGVGEGAPHWSVVFALLQPDLESHCQTCVLMLWRRGRLVRFFPRRALRVSAAGHLERNQVSTYPTQMSLLGLEPMAPVPAALCIDGLQGEDWIQICFRSRAAARLAVPSETSLKPFSVHEVLGEIDVGLAINGSRFSFRSPAIVEFAGGAA